MWASHPLRHGYSGGKQRFMGNEKRLLDEYTNICQTRKYGILFCFQNAAFIVHFGNKMNTPKSMLHKMYLHFL